MFWQQGITKAIYLIAGGGMYSYFNDRTVIVTQSNLVISYYSKNSDVIQFNNNAIYYYYGGLG